MNEVTNTGSNLPAEGTLKPLFSVINPSLVQRNIRPSSIYLAQGQSTVVQDRKINPGCLYSMRPELRTLSDGKNPFYFIPIMFNLSLVTRLYAGNKLSDNLGMEKPDKVLTNKLNPDIASPTYNEHLLQENNRKGFVDPQMNQQHPFSGFTFVHERKINLFVVPLVVNAQNQQVFEFPPFQWPLEKMQAVTLGEDLMTMLLSHCSQNPQGHFPFDHVYSVNVIQKTSAKSAQIKYFTFGELKRQTEVKAYDASLIPQLQKYYVTLCDLIQASQIEEDEADADEVKAAPPIAPAPIQQPKLGPDIINSPQPAPGGFVPTPSQPNQPQFMQQSPSLIPTQPVPTATMPPAPAPQPPMPQPPKPGVQKLMGAKSGQELTQKAMENFNKVPNNKALSQTIDYNNKEVRIETKQELDTLMDQI